MQIQLGAAKVAKYATRESGDTLEVIERPHGGISAVLVDGQRSGRNAKIISNIVARKAISLLGEGVRDGAADGLGRGNVHRLPARNCDISWIGGGDQMGGDKTVRFGNGIEFWATAHDCLVERCRLWEIYDAALTNQSGGPNTPQRNITYR